jgi:hypothetical protein
LEINQQQRMVHERSWRRIAGESVRPPAL